MAGTGKTYTLNSIINALDENDEYITIAPTHKACKLINGTTIHRMFGINPIDNSYEYKKAITLKDNGVKYIFIDE
eukprot:12343097-Heterocapsa_arctica.AAC.1